MIQKGDRIGDRFILGDVIKQNKTLAIYKGKEEDTGQPCVIKAVQKSEFKNLASARQQFRKEAESLSHMHHPRLPKVFFTTESADEFIFVTEEIEGINLENLWLNEGPLSLEETLDLGIQMCDVLAYFHGMHMVHRNLHVNSFTISDTGRCMLTDLGSTSMTKASSGFATQELQSEGPGDEKAEIRTLSIVLFQLLVDETIEDDKNALSYMEVATQVCSDPAQKKLMTLLTDCRREDVKGKCDNCEDLGKQLKQIRSHLQDPTSRKDEDDEDRDEDDENDEEERQEIPLYVRIAGVIYCLLMAGGVALLVTMGFSNGLTMFGYLSIGMIIGGIVGLLMLQPWKFFGASQTEAPKKPAASKKPASTAKSSKSHSEGLEKTQPLPDISAMLSDEEKTENKKGAKKDGKTKGKAEPAAPWDTPTTVDAPEVHPWDTPTTIDSPAPSEKKAPDSDKTSDTDNATKEIPPAPRTQEIEVAEETQEADDGTTATTVILDKGNRVVYENFKIIREIISVHTDETM